jgi:hypothetical protein
MQEEEAGSGGQRIERLTWTWAPRPSTTVFFHTQLRTHGCHTGLSDL